jgi:hypothetical protein
MTMTEEKIASIKKLLKNGEPEGEIKEQLKKEGFSDEEIAKAFSPHHYDMRLWYLVSGLLISSLGLYLFLMSGALTVLCCGIGVLFAFYAETKRLQR